jgi:hypothetical protein
MKLKIFTTCTWMFCVALLCLFFLGTLAQAQRGNRIAAPSSGMRHAGTGTGFNSVGSHSSASFGSFGTGLGSTWKGGFGFLSSGNNLAIQAAINPATQLKLAFAQKFLRNRGYGGGYYLLDGGGYYPVSADDSSANPPQNADPQVVMLQQAPTAVDVQQSAVALDQSAALPDEGQFTLVLKDGKNIQATAFSTTKDKIIYIATDGTRHTISANDLDSSATENINQERGTPLQLHP